MIKISARLFAAAWPFASTEETRYYLNGVHVEPHHEKGALLVATDGHLMFIAHDLEGECSKSAILAPGKAILSECIGFKQVHETDDWDDVIGSQTVDDGETRILTVDAAGHVEIVGHLRELRDCRIDGKFPNWRKVLPARQAADVHASPPPLNSLYLASFAEAARKLSPGDNTATIRVVSTGYDKPAYVLFGGSGGGVAIAVQMPTRVPVSEFPAFLVLPHHAEAAE